jgi:hypothetical protein
MRKLAVICSVLLSLNAVANAYNTPEFMEDIIEENTLQYELEQTLFENFDDLTLEVDDIDVVELEEVVSISFDTSAYLPERFNPKKGMHDVDWNTIDLIELEEELEFGFDTKAYLPKGFDPHKQMNTTKKETIVVSLY